MKHWNKQHKVREQCWFTVAMRPTLVNPNDSNLFSYKIAFESVFRQLQRHPSKGKFFIDAHHYDIWRPFRPGLVTITVMFARREDAIWFKLSYG